jgi:hypothetical protein
LREIKPPAWSDPKAAEPGRRDADRHIAGRLLCGHIGNEGADLAIAKIAKNVAAFEVRDARITRDVAADYRAAPIGMRIDSKRKCRWMRAWAVIIEETVALVLRPAKVGTLGACERKIVDLFLPSLADIGDDDVAGVEREPPGIAQPVSEDLGPIAGADEWVVCRNGVGPRAARRGVDAKNFSEQRAQITCRLAGRIRTEIAAIAGRDVKQAWSWPPL